MIPVDQTQFGEQGNCFAACVASILEIKLDEVPNFCAKPDGWWLRFLRWMSDRGWGVIVLDLVDSEGASAAAFLNRIQGYAWIGSGPADRGLLHAVVYCGREMVHDPHPSRAGLQKLEEALFITPAPSGCPIKVVERKS